MPLYQYRVRTRDGRVLEGNLEAVSEAEAAGKLRAQGHIITRLTANKDLVTNVRRDARVWGRVSLKDLALFSRQLATLINAGVSIMASLKVLQQQSSSAKLQQALSTVAADLEGGFTFAAALRKHPSIFPDIMVNTVAAGEVGGVLDRVLERIADHFEREHEMNQKIWTAMFYPLFVLVMAIGVIIFMLTMVLPNFVDMFNGMGVVLPLPTRILLAVGETVRNRWYLYLSFVILSALAFRWWAKTDQGRHLLDRLALRLPIFGTLILGRAISRFARTMATLTHSGVSVIVALDIAEKVADNVVIGDALRASKESVRSGQSIAGPLMASHVFPAIVTQMIAVGEETGQLDSLLDKVADFYDRDTRAISERLGTMIEPLMIGLLALVIGTVAMAILMPMLDQFKLVD